MFCAWCVSVVICPAVCINVWVLHAELMPRVVGINYSEPVILSTMRTCAIVCFSALWLQRWPISRDVYCSQCWLVPRFPLCFYSIFSQCVLACLLHTNMFVRWLFHGNIISRCFTIPLSFFSLLILFLISLPEPSMVPRTVLVFYLLPYCHYQWFPLPPFPTEKGRHWNENYSGLLTQNHDLSQIL